MKIKKKKKRSYLSFLLMKFSTITTASLFLFSAANALTLENTFKNNSHKNVAFFATFGGSSHYNWVLSVVDELGSRGHNSFFITGVSLQVYQREFLLNIVSL
jgi:hypothetical protein